MEIDQEMLAKGISADSSNQMIWPISVAKYEEMVDAGILTSDDLVELIQGRLIAKMPKNQPHIIIAHLIFHLLNKLLDNRGSVQLEASIYLEDSVPEPDLVILTGKLLDYLTTKPTAADVACIIEVSDSTLGYDRTQKKSIYAAANIPIYWIINLVDSQIEVYEEPIVRENPTYKRQTIYLPGDHLAVAIDSEVLGQINVAELFPTQSG